MSDEASTPEERADIFTNCSMKMIELGIATAKDELYRLQLLSENLIDQNFDLRIEMSKFKKESSVLQSRLDKMNHKAILLEKEMLDILVKARESNDKSLVDKIEKVIMKVNKLVSE